MDFLIDIVRSFFFFLDGLIYSFIVIVYNLFVDIAQTSIFTDEIIDLFASRVYVLLGIFMLFKVSFSILTYIINPDSFLDKNKGFPKLISNILITLVLLLLTPWFFSQLMDIQRIILRDNIIGKIFSTTDTNSNVIGDAGNVMAYQTYKAFFHINTDVYTSCVDLEKNYDPSNPSAFDECKTKGFNDSDNFENFAQNLRYAYETNSISIYMNSDLLNQNGSDNDYTMYYLPFISTLAGGAIALLLIVFCFDIAVRSIKLGFLRMLAPVPIVSRIDPQKGKEVFDKWLKLCISVYLDLFIRLIAIYFAIFVITQLMDFKMVDAVTGLEKDINVFVRVFIILGALLFAKQLPQLISDLTGVKMDGKFTLNPFKKLSEVPIAGKAANLAIGGVDSMLHGNGFMAGVKRNWKNVPLSGGDGKTSVLDTADRKMRKEIKEKSDMSRQRYEGIERQKKLKKQRSIGERYSGLNPEEIYDGQYLESFKNVSEAKKRMYEWENYVTKVQSDYQAAVNKFGSDSDEARKAYKDLTEANASYGQAKGQYEYRKSLHDAMKGQFSKYAEIEDAIEAFEKTGGKAILNVPFEENFSGDLTFDNSDGSITPPTHGPNGRGDPVPGQPNPNTSQKKKRRRNNN